MSHIEVSYCEHCNLPSSIVSRAAGENATLCPSCDAKKSLQYACKEALAAFQLRGSGQPLALSDAEYCDLLGEAISKAEKYGLFD